MTCEIFTTKNADDFIIAVENEEILLEETFLMATICDALFLQALDLSWGTNLISHARISRSRRKLKR